MYPTVVIVLVESQRSMTNICEISLPNPSPSRLAGPVASEARAAASGHPSSVVLNNTMDNEAEYRPSRVSQSQDVQKRGLEKVIL